MGKRIISQRSGRGTHTYKSPGHRFKGVIKHRVLNPKEELVKGKIIDLINCPGHSAPLAKIKFEDNKEILIAAPEKIKVGDEVTSGNNGEVNVGNTLLLKNIPEGTAIFNIEAMPGDGGKFVRTAGTFAKVITRIGNKVTVQLPSKKQKTLNANCRATIGTIAGGGRKEKPFLKAGKKMHAMRAKNKLYPRTSGVAMNAVDHPFGSGRGRHAGKPLTVSRDAPPGRKVGLIAARRTGKRK
ncbi:MAG: 50S ribosomal protein L2 [Nanoarchaeota archaeon]|nr:50S ribosomal protein L2 [Nanoarchaeota archaeon]MBU4241888.1 50S ribosomal protein L2 [Nanoarchaeota archaeon]MBU4352476.1 50S ribosomal protein L2 [Nanoarchaeota archaeon]MBU4455995.1 50S ribosomal protein L2 [Nanoarchaeota archaeon]MCG2719414.1 50S ribosomal protein L2 [Nanoarchaeota archaeon]